MNLGKGVPAWILCTVPPPGWRAGGVSASCASVLAAAALPAGAGYFAACLAGHAVPGGRSGLRPAAPRAAAHPTTACCQPTPAPAPAPTPTTSPTPEPKPTPQPSTAPKSRTPGLSGPSSSAMAGERAASHFRRAASHSTACADARPAGGGDHRQPAFCRGLNSDEPQVLIPAHPRHRDLPDLARFTTRPQCCCPYRTTALNMCAVGARMAEVLNAAGIHTLHDETLHDSPSYTEIRPQPRHGQGICGSISRSRDGAGRPPGCHRGCRRHAGQAGVHHRRQAPPR